MSFGLHGKNGLDPETPIHLMQIYLLPVLVYWYMEWKNFVLHTRQYMDMPEKFNKKYQKMILPCVIFSLPVTTADPAVYIISGTLPIEVIVHRRVLTFYWNRSAYKNQLRLSCNFTLNYPTANSRTPVSSWII